MFRVVFTVARVSALVTATIMLLAGCSSSADTTSTVAHSCSAWTQVTSGNVQGPIDSLSAVAASSPTNGWAVGYEGLGGGVLRGLIERWDGTTLQVAPGPNTGDVSFLNGVTMVPGSTSPSWWAVGSFEVGSTTRTLILQNSAGTTWSIVPSEDVPDMDNQLVAVSADSPTDAWAVGSSSTSSPNTSQELIEHWNGATWSIVPSANNSGLPYDLNGVLALSPNDVWAVGKWGGADPMAIHWNGKRWTFMELPLPSAAGTGALNGITAVPGTTELWAVGHSDAGPLVEQWSGGKWTSVSAPAPSGSELSGVAAVSAGDAWAVGTENSAQPLIMHWNGATWSVSQGASLNVNGEDVSSELTGVAAIPSTSPGRILAVGDYLAPSYTTIGRTLAETIC